MSEPADPNGPAAPPPAAGPPLPPPVAPHDATPPPNMRLLAVCFLVGLVLAVALANWLVSLKPGNRLVVVNANPTFLDSVTVDPEPAGANWFVRRYGAVAGNDSAWVRLPPGEGTTDIKVWRGGHVIADHAVDFGGNTIFEVRVGEGHQLGRYRRLGR
jgi:hypothetical protein